MNNNFNNGNADKSNTVWGDYQAAHFTPYNQSPPQQPALTATPQQSALTATPPGYDPFGTQGYDPFAAPDYLNLSGSQPQSGEQAQQSVPQNSVQTSIFGSSFGQPQNVSQGQTTPFAQPQNLTQPLLLGQGQWQEHAQSQGQPGEQKKAKKSIIKGRGRGLFAVIAVLCLVLGGGLGFGVGAMIKLGREITAVGDAPPSSTPNASLYLPETEKAAVTTTPIPKSNSNILMSAPDIYAASVGSCVGISVEVSYDSWYGTQVGTITGSGFVISSDGYIVTNYHVVEEAFDGNLDVTISMYDGTEYTAVIVGTEPANDIALLKIDPNTELVPLPLGSLDNVRIGEDVYVIGNPLGYLTFTFTEGIISALGREIHTDTASDIGINMFQISAPINSGNSGGPVFNDRGEVIGVASAKNGSASVEGLGFAVPMDDVIELLDEWQKTGFKPRAVLGVTVQPIDGYDKASGEHIKGAGIVSVVPGSAADKAGILAYDVVSKIDGHDVVDSSDLISYLRHNYSAGNSAKLTIYRTDNNLGKYITIEVTFDAGTSAEPVPEEPLPEYFR